MNIKKSFATLGLILLALTIFGATGLIVGNASDAQLRPEVSAKLLNIPPLSLEEKQAARLISQLNIPFDSEPKLCSSRSWCPKSEILKPEISAYLERFAPSLVHYHELVKLPQYATEPKNLGRGIFDFLEFANLQRREWNLQLAKSTSTATTKSVALEMRNLNRFLLASLTRPKTIVEAQIFLMLLKSNRNFLVEAAQAEPALRTAFKSPDFQPLTTGLTELEFAAVAAAAYEGEMRSVAIMLERPLTFEALELSEIEAGQSKPSFLTPALDKFVQTGFLRNETLNRHSEMLESSIAKISSDAEIALESHPRTSVSLNPRNFVGRRILLSFSSSVDDNFYRMKQTIAMLRSPLSLEALPN